MDCGECHKCLEGKFNEDGWAIGLTRFIVCPDCGNKRCPKATNHDFKCTDSNEPGQEGSFYSNV